MLQCIETSSNKEKNTNGLVLAVNNSIFFNTVFQYIFYEVNIYQILNYDLIVTDEHYLG